MSEMSSKEVADRIGVSMSTLKNWAVRLPVPSQMASDGTRIFPEEALAVLEAVKQLRGEERSYETIRRTIVVTEARPADVERSEVSEDMLLTVLPACGQEGLVPSPSDDDWMFAAPSLASGLTPVAAPELASELDEDLPPQHNEPVAKLSDEEWRTLPEFASPQRELELSVTLATLAPNEAGPSPDPASALLAQVVAIMREDTSLAEAYATARQRVGELEVMMKVMHDDRVRLQGELADARRMLGQGEVKRARRTWWQRLIGH